MAGEWKEATLGEFVALQRGHDLTDSERRPGNIPVMGSAGQNGFHNTAKAKGPGIVISQSGASFGKVLYCGQDYWPHNTALYVTDFKGNHPRFAYYFLSSIDFSRYNSGSAQPSLNRNYIYAIPVAYPNAKEQQAIACVLGALDDKIELNRRRNRTLEAMARAIFQSWFVDFDPVHAKAAGRKPTGMSKEVAKLFPAAFEDSKLGPIPKGWRVGTIKENAAKIQYGLTTSASAEQVGPRFLRITDIQGGRVQWDNVPYYTASESDQEKYRITDGDIFVARTGASTGENIYIVEPPAVPTSRLLPHVLASRGVLRASMTTAWT